MLTPYGATKAVQCLPYVIGPKQRQRNGMSLRQDPHISEDQMLQRYLLQAWY